MAEVRLFTSPCAVCGLMFSYDPETVPTLLIDLLTGKMATAKDPGVEYNPVCPSCVAMIQPLWKSAGFTGWDERLIVKPAE